MYMCACAGEDRCWHSFIDKNKFSVQVQCPKCMRLSGKGLRRLAKAGLMLITSLLVEQKNEKNARVRVLNEN